MKWILVYIFMSGTEPMSINALGPKQMFDSMTECFFAREKLAVTVGGEAPGYYPVNTQAICVKVSLPEV